MVPVLLIDSDHQARHALREALRREPELSVVGEIDATPAAIERIRRLLPKIVVIGLSLRRELELAERIMREAPRPLMLLSPESPPDPALVTRALGVGALEVRPRLPSPSAEEYEKARARLARSIRVLAAVPVVTRMRGGHAPPLAAPEPLPRPAFPTPLRPAGAAALAHAGLLVIGASTGGPPVLEALLLGLPNPFPLPIAIVQHMTSGFNREFVNWLSECTRRPAVMVEQPTPVRPGTLYLACDDRHLVFKSRFEITASASDERRFQRPSVDVLFESAAKHFGGQVAAVLLTGMGSDGVEGMATLKERGAYTLAQSPESCAVDSMPYGAISRAVVDVVADPAGIAAALSSHCA